MRIAMDHACLQYTGRVDFTDPRHPVFLYPATSVRFRQIGRASCRERV